MSDVPSRREFIRRALAAGTASPLAWRAVTARAAGGAPSRPASDRLNIGIIGVAGRGAANLKAVSGENIVALCDIDRHRLAEASKEHPEAKVFEDCRRLLDLRGLDAVVVSTPDHMHAIPAVRALSQGLDVYCEKPLAHSVHEVRVMRETAARHGRVTQMGTQIHAGDNYRRVVEIVRSGFLGAIPRVHVWMGTNRPIPGQRVASGKPPGHVNYDLWLGPAPERPFHESHFHFRWRYWWDFGGGVLADFGCHYMDLPHWALDLRHVVSVEARGEKTYEGDNEVPDRLRVDYRYPGRGDQPPVHLTWYHGPWRPEGAEAYDKGAAVLFEGERGRLLADYTTHRLFLSDGSVAGSDVQIPGRVPIPPSIGHHREWLEAIRSRGPTTCNFDESGALAETVLLGNVAYRAGRKLDWDAEKLAVRNDVPGAGNLVRREYRKGWTLEAAS